MLETETTNCGWTANIVVHECFTVSPRLPHGLWPCKNNKQSNLEESPVKQERNHISILRVCPIDVGNGQRSPCIAKLHGNGSIGSHVEVTHSGFQIIGCFGEHGADQLENRCFFKIDKRAPRVAVSRSWTSCPRLVPLPLPRLAFLFLPILTDSVSGSGNIFP